MERRAWFRNSGKPLFLSLVFVIISSMLTACGGGSSGGGSSSGGSGGSGGGGGGGSVETASMNGGGVDGPLAFSIVTLYTIDTSVANFKGAALGVGSTDSRARIVDIDKPSSADAPYLLEFSVTDDTRDLTACSDDDSSGTIDVATECLAPVVGTLRTIVTAEMLDSDRSVYATLLTTMATDIAIKATFAADGTTDDLLTALDTAAGEVKSTLGFGLNSSTNIFTTSPILDADSDTAEEQEQVAAYRSAVQALASVIDQISDAVGGADPSDVLTTMSNDLADGSIDGQVDGATAPIYAFDDDGDGTDDLDVSTAALQLLDQDPASLPVPNDPQGRTVGDMAAILVDEIEETGNETLTTEIDENTEVALKPAEKDPDLDDDGTPNESDAFPLDATETTDTDGDGTGNNTDTDDDNDGVPDTSDDFPLDPTEKLDTDSDGTGNNADDDDDGDGVPDSEDDFPLDASKSNAEDVDGDGWPVGQDTDDNDFNNPGTLFVDSDGDGSGNDEDLDDDNDGVPDDEDAFPTNASEQKDTDNDGYGDNSDDDIDGDGRPNHTNGNNVLNDAASAATGDTLDKFPRNSSEWKDTDKDGQGNNADTDDDNDGLSDIDESDAGTNPLLIDTDGDGALDGSDVFPLNPYASFDSDNDGIPARPANVDFDDVEVDGLIFDNCPATANPEQLDNDQDGKGDKCDRDDDGDGVLDVDDDLPLDANETTDTDGDGVGNNADDDDDNDGTKDQFDAFPLDASEKADTDGDEVGNNADDDDDGDGVPDDEDDFPLDATKFSLTDVDNDGWPSEQDPDDNDDTNPGEAFVDTDGDGVGNAVDEDDDNDGVPDDEDDLPLDNRDSIDTDNDGVGDSQDTDIDGDQVDNDSDAFPYNPAESVDSDGDGIGNEADLDDDNDGIADGDDTDSTNPDVDGDGIYDGFDNCPLDSNAEQKDADSDGAGNACDTDDDQDTVADEVDNCPFVANTNQENFDGDSKGDACDSDDDNDTITDASDNCPLIENADQADLDGDDQGNACDDDDDGDTISDSEEESLGTDPLLADTDSDTHNDNADNCPVDANEDQLDTDSDMAGNVCDDDDDGDSVADVQDNCPLLANDDQADANDNGVGDVCEGEPADLAGFWLASITVDTELEEGTLPDGSSIADICDIDAAQQHAAVAFIKQEGNDIHLQFGDDDNEEGDGDIGTIDGLGNVEFGNDDSWNEYDNSIGTFAFSTEESFSFQGELNEAGDTITGVTITENIVVYDGEDQTGSATASCSYTYSGSLTRMPQVAASDLLDAAGSDQGLAFTDSWHYYFDITGVDIREFGYTLIDASASADYGWTGSDWEAYSDQVWLLVDTGWASFTDTPSVQGTPATTATLVRGDDVSVGSQWEVSGYAATITGLPIEAFLADDWEEGVADPTAVFASANARATGVTVTSQMDEYEILCDYQMPVKGLLACENWIWQSFPDTGDEQDATVDNLADTLSNVLHLTSAVPTTPIQGIPVGENQQGDQVFAWLVGDDASGAVSTEGDVAFYLHNGTNDATILSEHSSTWSITDPSGTGALLLQFSLPENLPVDRLYYHFENNFDVMLAAVALDDDTPYLRVGSFSAEGTVRQFTGINGVALDEAINGFAYSKPDTDEDTVTDDEDNCPLDANSDQADSDSNNIGDVCDTGGSDDTDTDGDGIIDSEDNCPDQYDPSNVCSVGGDDTDGDGIVDSEDNCPDLYDPTNVCDTGSGVVTDTDSDGVPDEEDDFIDDATEQHDSDGDGVGDNSDNCPFIANPSQGDDCAFPGVDMSGIYVINWTATGEEYDEQTSACVSLTETSGIELVDIEQIGNQVLMRGDDQDGGWEDRGVIDANGGFVIEDDSGSFTLSGDFIADTEFDASFTDSDNGCESSGTGTFSPGTEVTESDVAASLAWFESDHEWDESTQMDTLFFEYGVISDVEAERFFEYGDGAWEEWLDDEIDYFVTDSGIDSSLDRYMISGYLSAGETAIINPLQDDGVTPSSLKTIHVDLREINVEDAPMARLLGGDYQQAIAPDAIFETDARLYVGEIVHQNEAYEFWCDDDWNAYVAATYNCANIVAKAYDDLDSNGEFNDPVAAVSLDEVVSTASEFDTDASGTGQWIGEGYDSVGSFQLNGYLISDDGNAAGANLIMKVTKHYNDAADYWGDKLVIDEIDAVYSSVGGVNLIQWTVPDIAAKLADLDAYDIHAFIFEESTLDSTPLVRRGEYTPQGFAEKVMLFNAAAKDQILAAFNYGGPDAAYTDALNNGVNWDSVSLVNHGLSLEADDFEDQASGVIGRVQMTFLFDGASSGFFTYDFEEETGVNNVFLQDLAFTWQIATDGSLEISFSGNALDGEVFHYALSANDVDTDLTLDVVLTDGRTATFDYMIPFADFDPGFTPAAFSLNAGDQYLVPDFGYGIEIVSVPTDTDASDDEISFDGQVNELMNCDVSCELDRVTDMGYDDTDNIMVLSYGSDSEEYFVWDGSTSLALFSMPTPQAMDLQIGKRFSVGMSFVAAP